MSVLESAAFDGAIRNPDNSNHLMVIKDVSRRIRIYSNDQLLADSTNALRVMEIGKSVYDPVIYVPEEDLTSPFAQVDKTTFCPIKGNASYISHDGEEIGWAYKTPIEMAARLKHHFAFWPAKVRVIEGD